MLFLEKAIDENLVTRLHQTSAFTHQVQIQMRKLKSEQMDERERTISLLAYLGANSPELDLALLEQLRSYGADARGISKKKVMIDLISLIKPKNEEIQLALVEAMKHKFRVGPIGTHRENIGRAAFEALMRIKPKSDRVHRSLSALLQDKDPEIRERALRVLREASPELLLNELKSLARIHRDSPLCERLESLDPEKISLSEFQAIINQIIEKLKQ